MSNESVAYSNIDRIINEGLPNKGVKKQVEEQSKPSTKIVKFPIGNVPNKKKIDDKAKPKTSQKVKPTKKNVIVIPSEFKKKKKVSESAKKHTAGKESTVQDKKKVSRADKPYIRLVVDNSKKKEEKFSLKKMANSLKIKLQEVRERNRRQKEEAKKARKPKMTIAEKKEAEAERKLNERVKKEDRAVQRKIGRNVKAIMEGKDLGEDFDEDLEDDFDDAEYQKPRINMQSGNKILKRIQILTLAALTAGLIYGGTQLYKEVDNTLNTISGYSENQVRHYYINNTVEAEARASESALLSLKDTEYLLGMYLETNGYEFTEVADDTSRYGFHKELITDEDVTVSIEELQAYWETLPTEVQENLREPNRAWEAHIKHDTKVFDMEHVNIVYSKNKDTVDPYLQALQEEEAEKAATQARLDELRNNISEEER